MLLSAFFVCFWQSRNTVKASLDLSGQGFGYTRLDNSMAIHGLVKRGQCLIVHSTGKVGYAGRWLSFLRQILVQHSIGKAPKALHRQSNPKLRLSSEQRRLYIEHLRAGKTFHSHGGALLPDSKLWLYRALSGNTTAK